MMLVTVLDMAQGPRSGNLTGEVAFLGNEASLSQSSGELYLVRLPNEGKI